MFIKRPTSNRHLFVFLKVVAFHILSILSAVVASIFICISIHPCYNFAIGRYCTNTKDVTDHGSEHFFFDFAWCSYTASEKVHFKVD